jgi:hypothetical protein
MSDHDQYLIASERPVVVTHRHWASLIKVGFGSAGLLLAAAFVLSYLSDTQFFAVIGVLLLLGSVGWFGVAFWEWSTEEFVITDRRVLLISGLITRRVAIMPLSKVTDLTYERSLAGRLLGYGVFVVESAGQHQALSRIDFMPRPDRLYHDVSTLLFGAGSAQRRYGRQIGDDDDDDYGDGGDRPTMPLPKVR